MNEETPNVEWVHKLPKRLTREFAILRGTDEKVELPVYGTKLKDQHGFHLYIAPGPAESVEPMFLVVQAMMEDEKILWCQVYFAYTYPDWKYFDEDVCNSEEDSSVSSSMIDSGGEAESDGEGNDDGSSDSRNRGCMIDIKRILEQLGMMINSD